MDQRAYYDSSYHSPERAERETVGMLPYLLLLSSLLELLSALLFSWFLLVLSRACMPCDTIQHQLRHPECVLDAYAHPESLDDDGVLSESLPPSSSLRHQPVIPTPRCYLGACTLSPAVAAPDTSPALHPPPSQSSPQCKTRGRRHADLKALSVPSTAGTGDSSDPSPVLHQPSPRYLSCHGAIMNVPTHDSQPDDVPDNHFYRNNDLICSLRKEWQSIVIDFVHPSVPTIVITPPVLSWYELITPHENIPPPQSPDHLSVDLPMCAPLYWRPERPYDDWRPTHVSSMSPLCVFSPARFAQFVERTSEERLHSWNVLPSVRRHHLKAAVFEASLRASQLRTRYDSPDFTWAAEKPFSWTDPAEPILQVYSRFLGTTILDSQHPCTVPHIVISDCPPQSLWIGHLNGTSPEQDYRYLSPFYGAWGAPRAITTSDNMDADSHSYTGSSCDVLSDDDADDSNESRSGDIMDGHFEYYSGQPDVPTLHDELSALHAGEGETKSLVVSDSDLDLIPTPSWEEPDHGPWGIDDEPYFRPDTPAPATPPDEGSGMLSLDTSASMYRSQHEVQGHQEGEEYSLDTSADPAHMSPASSALSSKKSNPFYLDEDEDELPSLDDWYPSQVSSYLAAGDPISL